MEEQNRPTVDPRRSGRKTAALALAALVAALALLGWRHLQLREVLDRAHRQSLVCRQQAENLQRELEGLRREAAAGSSAVAARQALDAELARQGLSSTELVADLLARPELIPLEGVLGGRMRIPGPGAVRILTPGWAMAYVEDGHLAAEILLGYRVEGGEVRWRVLDVRRL